MTSFQRWSYLYYNLCLIVNRWLCVQWNNVIAPAIREAVIHSASTGSDVGSGGQQKVASTALYVLMQRAVVCGCPLSGQGLSNYFSPFFFNYISSNLIISY